MQFIWQWLAQFQQARQINYKFSRHDFRASTGVSEQINILCYSVLVSSDSTYKAKFLALLDLSVAIGILLFDFAWKLKHFAFSYLVAAGIFHHILNVVNCSELIRKTPHSFCDYPDYPINFNQVKKDIPILLIAQFDTFPFNQSSLDSINLLSLVSLIALHSLWPSQYLPLCILLQSCQFTWFVQTVFRL